MSTMTQIYEKIKNFLTENESKIVLFCGLILVSILSFEAGIISGQKWQNSPIIIEKTISDQNLGSVSAQETPVAGQNSLQEPKTSLVGSSIPGQNLPAGRQDCMFVGSKNSNKYHIPSSRCAKQIKPENLVCFSSVENALAKGYQAGCLK